MLSGMLEATIEDSVFPRWSAKEPDVVRRRGCIEHTFGKEVGFGLNRGRYSSGSKQTCAVPQPLRRAVREWRQESEGSKTIPKSRPEVL